MAMSLPGSGGGPSAPMVEMNMTPLIDVLLVLLIMFIVTIPVMTHAVKLDMPQATNQPPPTVLPEVIDLEVDFDGTIVWNGTVVSLGQLETYFRDEAVKDPQPEIHLRPDRRARELLEGDRRRTRLSGQSAQGCIAEPAERERFARLDARLPEVDSPLGLEYLLDQIVIPDGDARGSKPEV